jgi:multiple sugar transport system ATP-binding protein
MSHLELSRLEKTYPDGTRAVKGVDLAVEEGEFIVLLGPSGCGKTTTLRMVAGLELPTGGRVTLAGRDVTALRPSRRDVGMVFQFYALYPHMTVRRNIAFPLECAGLPRTEIDARVDAVAERTGLRPLLASHPRHLSGGDQQRVALARAMVRRPRVYLFDEPLGTIDADQRLALREFIRRQQLDTKVTTLYVTHDQEEAMSLADRVVVMNAGLIEQVGPPAEVYDRPASLFVANFVGSPGMNLIPDRDVTLGVRPEFVRIDPDGPIPGTVVLDEYLGSARILHVRTPTGRILVRSSEPRPVGENVRLSFDEAHVRRFGRDGRRTPPRQDAP